MKMHEFLWYVKAVHEKVESSVENPGRWCWPTRDLLAWNIRSNREAIDPLGWRDRYQVARDKGFITVGPCAAHCHGPHVTLTAKGEATLARWMQQGCCAKCACRAHEGEVHLARRIVETRRRA